MKKCKKCKIDKEVVEFSKDSSTKDKLSYICKPCKNVINKKNRYKYIESNRVNHKKWSLKNREKRNQYQKDWRNRQPKRIELQRIKQEKNELFLLGFQNCTKCNQKLSLDCFWKNRNKKNSLDEQCNKCRLIVKRKWREDNKDKIAEYYENNKDNRNKYERSRRKTNPLFRLKNNLRVAIHQAINKKEWGKESLTQKTLGCDYKTITNHIEKQFIKGMSWDNYGDWETDHIIPLSSATTEQELRKLFHYTNMQPLWVADNVSKSKSIPLVTNLYYHSLLPYCRGRNYVAIKSLL